MNIADLTSDEIDEVFLFKIADLMRVTAKQGKSICHFDYDPAASLGLAPNPAKTDAGKITVAIAGGASRDLLKQAIELASVKH